MSIGSTMTETIACGQEVAERSRHLAWRNQARIHCGPRSADFNQELLVAAAQPGLAVDEIAFAPSSLHPVIHHVNLR